MARTAWLTGVRVAVCLAALAAPAVARGQTVVALSGGAAPGGGSYTSFGQAVLNNTGQVTFAATLTGGSANVGLYAGAAGAVQPVVRGGDAAPGGGTYRNPTSGVISDAFSDPVINASGQVAFTAGVDGGPNGMFVRTGGSVQAVALVGQSAPGTGNTFSSFSAPTLSPGGQVAFISALTGVTGVAAQNVFAGTAGGAVRAVALNGQTAPGPAAGGFYSFGAPTQDAAGQVGLSTYVSSNGGSSFTSGGYYAESGGQLRAVAVGGQPAPGGGTYATYPAAGRQPLATAGNGQIAFGAALTGGSANSGIFAGTATSVQAVALQGQAAPGGGTYAALAPGRVVVNASGRVAFSSADSVYAGLPGAIQAVAVAGQAAPGGGTFSGSPSTPLINAAGQVAFLESGTLYGWNGATLSRLVGAGDVVNGAGNRTVSDISYPGMSNNSSGSGRYQVLDDLGDLVVGLTFTDGSTAVAVYYFTPVPEPATVGLAAVAGLGLGRVVRRRCRRG